MYEKQRRMSLFTLRFLPDGLDNSLRHSRNPGPGSSYSCQSTTCLCVKSTSHTPLIKYSISQLHSLRKHWSLTLRLPQVLRTVVYSAVVAREQVGKSQNQTSNNRSDINRSVIKSKWPIEVRITTKASEAKS